MGPQAPLDPIYPPSVTGTAQDLIAVLTRAEELLLRSRPRALPAKTAAMRLWLESPLNLAGALLRYLFEVAPSDWILRCHSWAFERLASPYHYPFDGSGEGFARAFGLCRHVRAQSGKSPALLALTSHPPVAGEMAHLNFELVRHAMLALRTLREAPCRPRLVVAVDPFALDTTSLPVECLYAGVMGHYHVGLDRMILSRRRLSRLILKPTAWYRMPWRLLRVLSSGGEVGMALGGGVTSTGRTLYCAREWLGRWRWLSPLGKSPARVLSRLQAQPSFLEFEKTPGAPQIERSVWRRMEAWLISGMAGVFVTEEAGQMVASAQTGRLTESSRRIALLCLEALGSSAAQTQAAMEELAEELARETPYRLRFFQVLARRVLARGRPVVFLPIVHRAEDGFGVGIGRAWAWQEWRQGVLKAASGDPPQAWQGPLEEFVRPFVRENFS